MYVRESSYPYVQREKEELPLYWISKYNILTFVRAEFSVSGNIALAYEIQNVPLLFRYCQENGSLIYSPIEMNAIEGLAMTKRSVAIMNYLQRIVVPNVFNIHFHPISKKYLPALEQLDRPAADDTIPIDQ